MQGSLILNDKQVKRKIQRMAYQIWERNFNETALLLIGIKDNGYYFAKALAHEIEKISGISTEVFGLKINKQNPLQQEIETDLTAHQWKEVNIILVDDVQNSGRTMIYALRYLLSYQLKSLQCAVLIDRSHNQFPVKSDFVGLSLSTTLNEHVDVQYHEEQFKVFLQ
jgi:pyrimidine operon attenuation protein/uracil phosphoribosyltransferase